MENQEKPEVVRISTALEMLGCGRNKFYEKYNHRIRSFFNDTGYIKLFYLEDIKKIQKEIRNYKLVEKNVKRKKKTPRKATKHPNNKQGVFEQNR